MDNRRLSTGDLLASGLINQPAPKTEIPTDREEVEHGGDEASVIAAIEAGKVVSASNYYGIPNVWKAAEGVYRGTLLQYRSVTEDPTFATAEAAAEWFIDRRESTDG